MPKHNSYIEKIIQARQDMLDIGSDIGFQRAMDSISQALADPDIMGEGNEMSGEQIAHIIESAIEIDAKYYIAFRKHPEADYYQEQLDTNLRNIFHDLHAPFYERYPAIRKERYGK